MKNLDIRSKRLAEALSWLKANDKLKSQRELAQLLGCDENTISRAMTGKVPPSNDLLMKLNKQFNCPFNFQWLIGDSDVMEPSVQIDTIQQKLIEKGIPYYNVDFTLGFDIMENDQTIVPDSYIDFPQYNRCTCWVNAHGDSMAPTISSGDMVALKKIEDSRYLISGEIYAIVTKNGLRTIKRVNDKGESIQLIPDNKDYEEQYIPKAELLHVFVVKGCMKAY